MLRKMCDEITYPPPNIHVDVDLSTPTLHVDVWRIKYFIPQVVTDVIIIHAGIKVNPC